jgi:hypothetical protein
MAKKCSKYEYPFEYCFDGELGLLIYQSDGYYATAKGNIFSLKFSGRKLNHGEISYKKLSSFKDAYGYLKVNIRYPEGIKTRSVHRLVALCFHGESALEIDHLDRNKENNNIENLKYVTPKANSRNKKACGGARKLDEFKVLTIVTLSGVRPRREIADSMGVSYQTVKRVCSRLSYPEITKSLSIGRVKAGLKKEKAGQL